MDTTDIKALTQVMAVTLDEVKAMVDRLTDSLNIEFAPNEQLPLIAGILGFPYNEQDDPDFTRRQIKSAIDWYKTKGTTDSFKILFHNLGFDVDIIPLWTPDFCQNVPITTPFIFVQQVGLAYTYSQTPVEVTNPDGQDVTFVTAPPPC